MKGLTLADVKKIAGGVENTEGLSYAIQELAKRGVDQVGFSDGLGPFVAYKMYLEGVTIGGIVPALLNVYGQEKYLDVSTLHLMNEDRAHLVGKVASFKKSDEIFAHIERSGKTPLQVAAIDDSVANIGTLKKIQESGGLSFGFNVNDTKAFEEASIPILKGSDLKAFAEVVLDPSKLSLYCE